MLKKDIANDIGIDPVTFSYIFNRKRTPSVKVCKKLEKRTGIPARVWFEGSTLDIHKAWVAFKRKCTLEELDRKDG